MPTVSTLTIDLVANSAKLVGGLKKASGATAKWAKSSRRHINSTAKSFGVIATASAAGLGAVYVNAAKAADQLGKLSDQLGVYPVQLQGLQRAAELSGVAQESLNKALEKQSKNIGEARVGLGAALPFMKQLRLENEQFYNLNPGDQFKVIAERIEGLGTQQEKAAASSAFFGRQGGAMLNVLSMGGDALNQVEQDVKDYGIALTRVDIAKIEAANDSWFEAKEVTKGFGNTLAVELSPIIGAIAERFKMSAKEAGGMGAVAEQVASKIVNGIGFAVDAVNGLKLVWMAVKVAAYNSFSGIISGVAFLDRGISALLDKLPFVESSASNAVQAYAHNISSLADASTTAFQKALLEPPPSEKIKEVVGQIMDEAQVAAEEKAASVKSNIGSNITDIVVPKTLTASSFGDGRVDDEGNTNPFLPGANEESMQSALDLLTAFQEQKFGIDGIFKLQEQALQQVHEAELSDITDKEERRRVKARQNAEKQKAASTRAFMQQGAAALAGNSKKAFKIQQAMRIAETVQSTYSAAMNSYNALSAIPIVGPVLGVAAAAAAIAFGSAQVSKIKAQKFGGGGSVSSGTPRAVSASSSSLSTAATPEPLNAENRDIEQASRTVNVIINDAIDPSGTRRILEAVNEALGDGAQLNVEVA